jgi:hypothetical protein
MRERRSGSTSRFSTTALESKRASATFNQYNSLSSIAVCRRHIEPVDSTEIDRPQAPGELRHQQSDELVPAADSALSLPVVMLASQRLKLMSRDNFEELGEYRVSI